MPDPSPFYERHRWKAAAAVLALVGAVWAVTGAPTPWKLITEVTTEKLPASNTMLVVDSSRAMGRPFTQKTTKLDAALGALKRFTLPLKNEGLALRTFGGSCEDSGRVLVDFGAEHGDDVRNASADLRPQGRSNLSNAVRAAIDDLADRDRFPDDATQRIVVIMGSVDECAGVAAARDIRDDIEHSGVDAAFKFVGLKLGQKSRRRLMTFEKALGQRADVAFASTNLELDGVGGWLMQPASKTSECADDVDNDGDRQIDAADPQCATGDTEAPEQPRRECADGMDNDGDNAVDNEDPECASGTTEGPEQPAGECNDQKDNDEDGQIDGDDPECATGDTEAPGQPEGECADGMDNDGDGVVDSEDPECASGTTEAAEQPAGDCNDKTDNDNDGRFDGDDPGCATGETEASG